MECWDILGIDADSDKRTIKRAYVKLLKQNNPEDDPERFQRIRDAYEQAVAWVESIDEPYIDSNVVAENVLESNPLETTTDDVSTTENTALAQHHETDTSSPEHNRLQEAIAEIAHHLAGHHEEAAVASVQSHLADDFFCGLDTRYEYEGELLIMLCQQDMFYLYFADFLAEAFEWNINIHARPFYINNQFQSESEYYYAFSRVAYYYTTAIVRHDILNHYKRERHNQETVEQLEHALFSEFNEERLATFKTDKKHLKILKAICSYMDTKGYFQDALSPIPSDTLQWINDNKLYSSKDLWAQEEQGQSDGSDSSWKYAIIALVILVVLTNIFSNLEKNKNKEIATPDDRPQEAATTNNNANEMSEDDKKRLIERLIEAAKTPSDTIEQRE